LTTSKELKYKFGIITKYGKTSKCWLKGVNNSCIKEISDVIKLYSKFIGRNSIEYGTLILCAQIKKIQ
tara:strand:+ start:82 stop:285 length:204 start_codon:yes stop_codon:yes gene_type:complete